MVWSAGLLMGQSKPAVASKLQTMTSNINLTDKWARIHLARLCSALVYAEWTSTQTFVSGVGAPMWKMLVMLATRSAPHPCRHKFIIAWGWGGGAVERRRGTARQYICTESLAVGCDHFCQVAVVPLSRK